MARFPRDRRRRRTGGPRPPGLTSVRHGPGDSGWGRAALALLLLGGLLMAFNQQHSGDPLKIRRELRKF
ncbi:MAG: hypothetical protein ACK55X_08320 [Synechococcaceae cyanobacterium]